MLISTDEKVQREFQRQIDKDAFSILESALRIAENKYIKEFFIFEPRIKLANAILKRAIELMK